LRILIHGINFSPELTGIGKYSGELAEWLAIQGHSVRVVTASPYYPQWKISKDYTNCWQTESINFAKPFLANGGSLLIYRCPLWVPVKPSGLKRLLHLASFALASLPIMLRLILWRPDLVLVVEPPLFCAPQSWIVARLSGARAWLHIQDFEVDAAFDLGLLKGNLIKKIVLSAERWLLYRFDRVSTISNRMRDRLLIKGVRSDKVILFPNWVDISGLNASTNDHVETLNHRGLLDYRSELNIPPGVIVALYSGNMGEKQGLEILAEAASQLQASSDIYFVFCGNGAGRDKLVLACSGLTNVSFIDLQPMERLGELLQMADIHLLPQRADAADLVMPSKLTGMLASGRPIVATSYPGTELESVVKNFGIVVTPGDAAAFAEAITTLAKNPKLREQLGKEGRDYAKQNLDKEIVLAKFEEEVYQLIN
jgi:colanic acid biosynthesis glycosyl transferase WcaI